MEKVRRTKLEVICLFQFKTYLELRLTQNLFDFQLVVAYICFADIE